MSQHLALVICEMGTMMPSSWGCQGDEWDKAVKVSGHEKTSVSSSQIHAHIYIIIIEVVPPNWQNHS